MTADELMMGTFTGHFIKFMQEGTGEVVEVELTSRTWDVTDPQARYAAAIEELGPLDDVPKHAVMWFINEERNDAALCVYRPWAELVQAG